MGKLFGKKGGSSEDGETAEEAPTAQAAPAPAPVAAPAPTPAPIRQSFSSIEEYAATLPAPDYVDPAGKASANAEAA